MSYEGYEVWLCSVGHRHYFDCYNSPHSSTWKCDVEDCESPLVWRDCVDETNCDGEERKLEIDKEATYKTCECCGNKERLTQETFKIPAGEAVQYFGKDWEVDDE